MSDRLRMLGVFGAGFALGAVLAWTAPPAGQGDGSSRHEGKDKGPAGMMPPGSEPSGMMPGQGAVGGPPPDGQQPIDNDLPIGAPPPGISPDGPPPPPGAGPPDGAQGPPLGADGPPATPPSAAAAPPAADPEAPPSQGGADGGGRPDWVTQHMQNGRAFWEKQASRLAADAKGAPFAARARALAASVPAQGERPPPLPDVVVLLTRELELYDDMKAGGVDVTAVETELSRLLLAR